MKYFQLILTVVLLVCLVGTTALAGVEGGKKLPPTPQGTIVAPQEMDISDAEIPAQYLSRAKSTYRDVDYTFSVPPKNVANSATLAKYPSVSAAGLSGTYSIPGDFPTISAAISVLNFAGLSGNTILELASASYTENAGDVVVNGTYPGAGTFSVTLQPAAGVAATINFVPTATQGKGISMDGAKNFHIDGINSGGSSLTLQFTGGTFPTSDVFAATVYMTGNVDDVSVNNSTIEGQIEGASFETMTNGRAAIFLYAATGQLNENVTIDGNTIIYATYAFKVIEQFTAPALFIQANNVNFTNNSVGGAFGGKILQGVLTEAVFDLHVDNNVFDGIEVNPAVFDQPTVATVEYDGLKTFASNSFLWNFGQYSAIHVYNWDGLSTISGNWIRSVRSDNHGYGFLVYGITGRISNSGQGLLSNNRITGIVNHDGFGQAIGFRTTNVRVYHNSVRLVDALVAPYTTLVSTGLNNDGASLIRNNIFQNEITGGSAASTRGVNTVASGVVNYSAIYSTGRPTGLGATPALGIAGGINVNGVYGYTPFTWDMHADSTTPTAAENTGGPLILLAADVDGDPRDTTVAGTRDAGADEFPVTGSLLAADAFPYSIPAPPAGGVPAGVPQTPTVSVKNNSNSSAGSFSVSLTISPDGYSDTKPVTLGPGEAKTISFASWTPAGAGPRTITATTLLGGDAVPGNDVFARSQAVDAPIVDTSFTFDGGAEGWTGAIDWVRSSTFTKLGGVNGGSGFSWVTQRPDDASTYTEGFNANAHGYATTYPGANLLTSPWLDLSTMGGTDLYISFQHSIETEPLWDRSWLQYTVDGTNWIDIGVLNDPDGINWYDEALYEHAALDPANFDDGTATLYGLGTGPAASWTSNDGGTTGAPSDFVPNGPSGYVYVQIHLTETSHAALVGASAARFRYVAFSDAVSAFGGWAFDNFKLTSVPPVFAGGTIEGHAWSDANGNGVDDGEADITGTKVYVSLFGSVIDSVLTSGTGDYTWSGVTLPAAYDLELDVSGVAYTVPFGTSGIQTVNHPSDGSTDSGVDFGTFVGSISGKKFNDVNDNGVNDSEPGLSGWTIEVYLDSVNSGELIGSDVTDGSGNYSILVPAYAGVYEVAEVAQPTVARQTAPVGDTYNVSITGGTPTSTGNDFGNWLYGRIRVQLTVDQNGNGNRDAGDIIAVPSGFSSDFTVKKNGIDLAGSPFTLGNGTLAANFTGLDTGTYVVAEVNEIAGWKRTNHANGSHVVSASGLIDTADALDFKYIVITGQKFDDTDGDGVKDGGEPGLAGWTINVSGGVYDGDASAVTDGSGNYSIDSVFTGSHVVSEVSQAGWTRTLPSGAGTYPITGISGNFVVTTGKDFGNFADATVSGIVYRDYNGNGVMDGPDAAYSGVTVNLPVNGGSDVSDGSGYSMTGVIAIDTIRITAPGGYVITQPAAGEYPLALSSGGSATGQNFGLFQTSDSSTKYRTFTAAQLGADDQKKPGKTPKLTKPFDPIKNKPNTANLVDQLIGKTGQAIGAIKVGLTGQLNLGGKTKAHVVPNKQSAFWASLNNKSVQHTGMARGFDLDLKGKPFLKLIKSFGPNKKQNNRLFANLLALQLNLVASGLKTPAGLGSLIYSDALSSLDGMTIDEIADYADTVMTNPEFVPLGVYNELDSVVAKINAAFYNGATDDTATGWASGKLTWAAYISVDEVPYLTANPGATPKNRLTEQVQEVPTAFALEQNYPNPFNPTTTIEFELPEASIVTLKIYNLLGQEVATLFDREEIELSETVEFDASSLPSGVYLYRIVAETIADEDAGIASETFTQVKKMVLVK